MRESPEEKEGALDRIDKEFAAKLDNPKLAKRDRDKARLNQVADGLDVSGVSEEVWTFLKPLQCLESPHIQQDITIFCLWNLLHISAKFPTDPMPGFAPFSQKRIWKIRVVW